MYLTAASAAWRYSGNVTGPDSRLSRPTTIGSPLAFLGVPSAAEASGVDVLEADLSLPDDEELSLPQPAAKAPISATATMLVAHFLVTFMSLLMVWLSGARHGGFAQVAGSQEVAPPTQVLGRALEHEPAVAEHVRPVGHLERERDVLLHEQHAGAEVLRHAAQDREQPLDDHRREPEAHLVDQEHARRAHQRAANREHLLLAAGQHPGLAVEALVQLRQQLDQLVAAKAALRLGELEVLADRHAIEQRPALGDERDAAARELVGGDALDALLVEPHRAADRGEQAGDRRQRRRLAGAVGAEQSDDLAGAHLEREVAHDRRTGVAGIERLHAQQGGARHSPPLAGCRGRRR